jgi:hypothetical protein
MRKKTLSGLSALVAGCLMSTGVKAKEQADPIYAEPRMEFNEADAAVLGANVGIGCVLGYFGATFRGEKIKAALTGCLKGAIGGTVFYGAEKTAVFSGKPGIGWFAHGLSAYGASMMENAITGVGLFDRVAYDLGPVRLAFGTKEANGGNYFQWHILAESVGAIAANVGIGNKLNVKTSLKTGTLVFESYERSIFLPAATSDAGYALANTITLSRAPGDEARSGSIIGHEQIHVVTNRGLGIGDTILRASDSYANFSDSAHLSLGGLAGNAVILGASLQENHADRPVEIIPRALTNSRWKEVRKDKKYKYN